MDHEANTDDEQVERIPVIEKTQARVFRLLAQAAKAAVAAGVPPEAFTTAAFQAYLTASPGLAERLADLQLAATIEELRSSGRLAKA